MVASVIDFLYLCIRNKKIPQTALQGLFWGKRKIIVMAKVQQISEITPSFAFTEFDFYKDYEESFKKSDSDAFIPSFHCMRWPSDSV